MKFFGSLLLALPELLKFLNSVIRLGKKLFGDDPKKFFGDMTIVITELENANKKEDQVNALKKLQRLMDRA